MFTVETDFFIEKEKEVESLQESAVLRDDCTCSGPSKRKLGSSSLSTPHIYNETGDFNVEASKEKVQSKVISATPTSSEGTKDEVTQLSTAKKQKFETLQSDSTGR